MSEEIKSKEIKCPNCKGEGGWGSYSSLSYDPPCTCLFCEGKGKVTQKKRMEFVRSHIGLSKEVREKLSEAREEW